MSRGSRAHRSAPLPAQGAPTDGVPDRSLNSLLTPRRLLEQEARRLPQELAAPRSALRTAWAYLGPAGALAYRRFAARDPLSHARAAELPTLALAVRKHLLQAPLDVLALGAGDGGQEVRLVQHLLADRTLPLSLCLQDLSEPLLSAAYLRAADSLPQAKAELWALLADLEELSAHADRLVFPGRQRLVLLLGGTLGELEDELRFLRYGLAWCERGDLLILDVPLAGTGATAARVSEQDEAAEQFLTEAGPWLTTALAPHLPGVPFEWSLRLESAGRVPGSLAVCAVATVHTETRSRESEVYRCRQYAGERLTESLDALGWELLTKQRYGASPAAELHLYRRRASAHPRAEGIPSAAASGRRSGKRARRTKSPSRSGS